MAKQLRYRYSYIHKGQKHWRVSTPTSATIRAWLKINGLDDKLDFSEVLRDLDVHGTHVTTYCYMLCAPVVEIDEYFVEV